jgi:hypothetical protein
MTAKSRPLFRSVDAHKILCSGNRQVTLQGRPGKLTDRQLHILLSLFTTTVGTFTRSHKEIARDTGIPLRTVARIMRDDWILGGCVIGLNASGKQEGAVWEGSRQKLSGKPGDWVKLPTRFTLAIEPVASAVVALGGLALDPAGLALEPPSASAAMALEPGVPSAKLVDSKQDLVVRDPFC